MFTIHQDIDFKKYYQFLNSEKIPEIMNAEPHLEFIVGTMFSGKTTELIRRTNLYEIAGIKSQIFKHTIDDRYSLTEIKSHDQLGKEVICVQDVAELQKRIDPSTDVIGIDEVQFFDYSIIDLCDYLANTGKIVIAAGLLKDFADNFFPLKDKSGMESNYKMSEFLRISDHITYLKALCTYDINGKENRKCAREASRVQRFVDGKAAPLDSEIIKTGGKGDYEPRCRQHFQFYQK